MCLRVPGRFRLLEHLVHEQMLPDVGELPEVTIGHEQERSAAFWKTAAGYVDEPPLRPFATRAEWLSQFDDEFDNGMDAAWLHDPTGVAPRLSLLQVPEPKTVKNRLHLDLRVSGKGTPEQRWLRVLNEVARLDAAGAATLQAFTGHHVVMADPEGNEFCVA